MQALIELEQQGWQALSSEGDAGKQFYRAILQENAVMIFPGDMAITGKAKILAAISAQPWKTFQIEKAQVISLSEDAGILTYRVFAQREGSTPYIAWISSTYIRQDGTWKLILHQQTPI